MKFFIASRWRNRKQVEVLAEELTKRGHEVYSFLKSGDNLLTGRPIDEEMDIFNEALPNWKNDPRISQIFKSEFEGIKGSDAVILLLPAGNSSHLEAGMAHGMGKKVYQIGPIEKPEIVYLIFDGLYLDEGSFLTDLDGGKIR